MEDKKKLLINSLGAERVKTNELLKYHTFSKIGGPSELFYIATTQKELLQALDHVEQLEVPYFILGSGTKALISDNGIKGLVIKNRTSLLKVGGVKGKVSATGIGVEEALIEADSGVSVGKLNDFLSGQNLKPINGVSSIHSSIGGAIYLDPQLQQAAQKIKVWENGEIREIMVAQLRRMNQVVLSVVLKVKAKS